MASLRWERIHASNSRLAAARQARSAGNRALADALSPKHATAADDGCEAAVTDTLAAVPSLFILEATPLSVGWQMILSVLFSLRCWPFPARCQVLAGNSAMGPLLVVPLAPRVVGTVQARDRGLRDKCNSPLWQLVLNQLKIQYR